MVFYKINRDGFFNTLGKDGETKNKIFMDTNLLS